MLSVVMYEVISGP